MAKPVRLTLYVDNDQLKKALKESDDAFDKFDKNTKSVGDKFRASTVAMGVAMGTIAVDIGKKLAQIAVDGATWLPKLGEEFDKVSDRIRVSVGKNPLLNAGLGRSFEQVFATTATSMGDAGSAVTILYQRLGFLGPKAEEIAQNLLNLSNITGTDVATNLDTATQALSFWNVQADYAPDVLNNVFRAFQETGTSVSDIFDQLGTSAAQLKLLGFSLDDVTTAAAGLGKVGARIDDIKPALNRLIKENPGKTLTQIFDVYVRGIKNGSITLEDAIKDLGTKGGANFYNLAKSGKLSFADLNKAINGNSDTIAEATKQTEDWPEKWHKAWNQLELAVKPVADRVFGFIGEVIDKMTVKGLDGQTIVGLDIAGAWKMIAEEWDKDWNEHIHPFLDDIWQKIQKWWDDGGKDQVGEVARNIGTALGTAMFEGLKTAFMEALKGLGGSLLDSFKEKGLGAWYNDLFPGGSDHRNDPGSRATPDYGTDRNGIPLDASGNPVSPYNRDGSFGPGRALGGPVTAGMPYIVGEHRRELFVPKVDGTILPSAGMGGKGDTFNLYGSDPRATVWEVVRQRRAQAYLAGGR